MGASADDDLLALFERACVLHGRERDALLDEVRARSPALAAELGALLRADDAGTGPVPRSLAADADARDGRTPELLARLRAKGDRYVRGAELGHGGMGVVYEAWDDELQRRLALKVMRDAPEGDSPAVGSRVRRLDRFLREARVTGRLQHPGVVPVHELGVDAQGRVFFTMPCVEGRTLGEVFADVEARRDGWTRTRALGVLQQICETVAHAHEHGVVHRDLKPDNVMVGRFGETYVMDWGIARVTGTESSARGSAHDDDADASRDPRDPLRRALRPRHTREGDVLGTPAYMAPEQARGDLSAIGPLTDVYAVGAMLHHLLAGRAPFAGRGSPGEIVRRLATGERARLPAQRRVPAELVAICERATAPDPCDRYRDMRALADDLRAYLEDRVVRAHRTGPWAEARTWVKRHRGVAGLGVVVVLLVLGLAGLFARDQRRARLEHVPSAARELLARAREGWPLIPASVPLMDSWLADVAALARVVGSERAAYDEWQRAPMVEPLEALLAGRDDYRVLQAHVLGIEDQLASFGAQLPSTRGMAPIFEHELSRRQALLEHLTASVARRAPRQVTDRSVTERALRVLDIVELEEDWVPRVTLDRELAARLALETIDAHARLWTSTVEAIAGSSEYGGLRLTPQVGLVPLGPDPRSGLFEFAHHLSGEVPPRGSDGRLVIGDESALVLVLIPGGIAEIGAQAIDPRTSLYDPGARDSEGPIQVVPLAPYFISKYEMTQGQWIRLTGDNPSAISVGMNMREGGGDHVTRHHPVTDVSWDDASAALVRWHLVLPSEVQWEHAARGGTLTPFWWGEEDPPENFGGDPREAGERRRADDDGYPQLAPVDAFDANGFGLHQVAGNVREWCRDLAPLTYENVEFAAGDGEMIGPYAVLRPVRGGGWRSDGGRLRSAARVQQLARSFAVDIGIRPAMRVQGSMP